MRWRVQCHLLYALLCSWIKLVTLQISGSLGNKSGRLMQTTRISLVFPVLVASVELPVVFLIMVVVMGVGC